jgi:hypothetical protein
MSSSTGIGSEQPDYLGPVRPVRRTGSPGTAVTALIGLAALAVAGTGTAAAVGLSGGGGAQPEDVLPAQAIALVKVDFDPGAGQRKALYQLGREFPELRNKLKSEGTLRDDVLSAVLGSESALDYATDVKPWIGDRAGVAVLAPAAGQTTPQVVAAVQYTDRAKADAGLQRAEQEAGTDGPAVHTFVPDSNYVLISETAEIGRAAVDADRHLADEPAYAKAVDKLEGDQLLLSWVDAARGWAAVPQLFRDQLGAVPGYDELKPSGQLALGLHADKDALELVGRAVGLRTGIDSAVPTSRGVHLLGQLPKETIGGLAVAGLGPSLKAGYAKIEDVLRESVPEVLTALDQLGLQLPGDVGALAGTETAVAAWGDQEQPHIAFRSRTGDKARALQVAGRLFAFASGQSDAQQQGLLKETGDGIVVGTDRETVDAAAGNGGLGQTPLFKKVMPDLDGASFAVFVDLSRAVGLADLKGKAKDNTAALEALGLTATSGPNGTLRLRMTFR